MPVTVVHFNPLRRRSGIIGRFSRPRPLNNFGDLIGPIIVGELVKRLHLAEQSANNRLVAVGSIMKLTRPGDVVWGAGVNGKSMDVGAAPNIDVRAVRGPLTRDALAAHGTEVPEIYGDPALLWSHFWPRTHYLAESEQDASRSAFVVVPNFHDYPSTKNSHALNPLRSPQSVVREIARSDFVCGSSLHGIVIAESFGIPARLIAPGKESAFKYDDYYAGTGRSGYVAAASVEHALTMGGEPPAVFDADRLLQSFPTDLWISASGRKEGED